MWEVENKIDGCALYLQGTVFSPQPLPADVEALRARRGGAVLRAEAHLFTALVTWVFAMCAFIAPGHPSDRTPRACSATALLPFAVIKPGLEIVRKTQFLEFEQACRNGTPGK